MLGQSTFIPALHYGSVLLKPVTVLVTDVSEVIWEVTIVNQYVNLRPFKTLAFNFSSATTPPNFIDRY